MSRKSKFSAKQKYNIIMEYKNTAHSMPEICCKYEIARSTLKRWRYKYKKYGIKGLENAITNNTYSKELKEQLVQDYMTGNYSKQELTKIYEISSSSIVYQWIKIYNSHRELKSTPKGMKKSMTKGRSTTWKERIEIVLDCIAKNTDYGRAAEKHKVSYQQVYQWVKKYKSDGVNALKDRRGRKKKEEELTKEDKIKIEMKKLQMENEKLKAENDFLKKLEELEGRRF